MRTLDAQTLQQDVRGVRYDLDTYDGIDFALLYDGAYQSELIRYLAQRIGDRGLVFWDVGANVGSVSLPVAAACTHSQVYSFEPSPPVMRRFACNLALNPAVVARVHPLALALSDHNGSSDFFVSNEPFNSGVGGLGRSHNRVTSAVQVRVAAADSLISSGELPRPDVVKVDVEGFEAEVFRGLVGLLDDAAPVEIIFEHCVYRFEERGLAKSSNVDFLRSHGFSLQVLAADQPTMLRPFEASDLDADCDIIARKHAHTA